MLLHERLEDLPGLRLFLRAVPPLGVEQGATHDVDRNELADVPAQREPFHVRLAPARHQERGRERRPHRLMTFDRYQNRLHAHPRRPVASIVRTEGSVTISMSVGPEETAGLRLEMLGTARRSQRFVYREEPLRSPGGVECFGFRVLPTVFCPAH